MKTQHPTNDTPKPATRSRAALLSVGALCACLVAAPSVFGEVPVPEVDSPVVEGDFGEPVGVIKGTARALSYDVRWHGDPEGEPLARVRGRFRLEGYPFPAAERYSSLFFLRDAHLAEHRVVETVANGADPALGLITLRPLPPRMGGLVGVVAEIERGDDYGILRYRRARIRVRDAEGQVEQVSTGPRYAFQQILEPGRYTLEVIDVECETPKVEVEIERGKSTPLVIEAKRVLPTPGAQR